MKIKYLGKVDDNSLKLYNPTAFLLQIRKCNGKEIELSFGLKKNQRSVNQNSYYWGVVIDILYKKTDVGYTPEEWHEALKFKFLKKGGEEVPTVTSTTLLNTVEMEDYLAKIRVWASDFLGCFIPLPHEEIDGMVAEPEG